jgi:hypothetical protein
LLAILYLLAILLPVSSASFRRSLHGIGCLRLITIRIQATTSLKTHSSFWHPGIGGCALGAFTVGAAYCQAVTLVAGAWYWIDRILITETSMPFTEQIFPILVTVWSCSCCCFRCILFNLT